MREEQQLPRLATEEYMVVFLQGEGRLQYQADSPGSMWKPQWRCHRERASSGAIASMVYACGKETYECSMKARRAEQTKRTRDSDSRDPQSTPRPAAPRVRA